MINFGSVFNPFASGSPFSALFGDYGAISNPSGAWDQLKNGRTNEVNQDIATKNLAFQRENFDYQKALQQKIFDREDSAYQRTVKDMRAAGMSPLMMNGTNGAGEALQTEPLHNEYQHQDKGLFEVGQLASSIYSNFQNAQRSRAEINNINADTDEKNTSNTFLPFSLAASLVGQILQNKSTSKTIQNQTADYGLKLLQTLEQSYKNADLKRWNEYGSMFGISSNMSEEERYGAFAMELLRSAGYDVDKLKKEGGHRLKSVLDNLFSVSEGVFSFGRSIPDNYKNHGFKFWKWKF